MKNHKIGFRRSIALGLALSLSMLFGAFQVQSARAYVSHCNTDPVLHLSNGAVLVLQTDIDTNPKDVLRIVYTVQLPDGVTVQSIHTWGRLHTAETILVNSQNPAGLYSADTVVVTATPGHAVSTSALLLSDRGALLSLASTSGFTFQDLFLQLASSPSSV